MDHFSWSAQELGWLEIFNDGRAYLILDIKLNYFKDGDERIG
ncbi:MAG: hypothetical protein ACTSRA_18870 [Promethearchaeota archaeon]